MPIRFYTALIAALLAASHAAARLVMVHDSGTLADAVAGARAGDDIVLADGSYAITHKLWAKASGSVTAPITVRAEHPLGAHITSGVLVGFEVTGGYWHFAGLDITGVCRNDSDCEHAFHVVGNASGYQLSGSRLVDFNAQLKVNSDGAHHLPADGLVENNEFFDTHPRHTNNPVTPVNIDNAVRWVVRGNWIHDFEKDGTGDGSYGAFVKGGSQRPVIERNLVACSSHDAAIGRPVGLSFGADGMDANLCPPHWDTTHPCSPEVTGGIMRNNIIDRCRGDGIYLSKARESKILYNTLTNTAGIEFRTPESNGVVRGNLMMGSIRAVDGARFHDGGNVSGVISRQKLASWQAAQPGRTAGPDPDVTDDYCGRPRGKTLEAGALQASLGPCPRPQWSGNARASATP